MSNFEDSVNHSTDIDERLTRIEKTLKDITNILKTASEIVPSSTECTTWSACTIPSTHISDEGEDEPYGI